MDGREATLVVASPASRRQIIIIGAQITISQITISQITTSQITISHQITISQIGRDVPVMRGVGTEYM